MSSQPGRGVDQDIAGWLSGSYETCVLPLLERTARKKRRQYEHIRSYAARTKKEGQLAIVRLWRWVAAQRDEVHVHKRNTESQSRMEKGARGMCDMLLELGDSENVDAECSRKVDCGNWRRTDRNMNEAHRQVGTRIRVASVNTLSPRRPRDGIMRPAMIPQDALASTCFDYVGGYHTWPPNSSLSFAVCQPSSCMLPALVVISFCSQLQGTFSEKCLALDLCSCSNRHVVQLFWRKLERYYSLRLAMRTDRLTNVKECGPVSNQSSSIAKEVPSSRLHSNHLQFGRTWHRDLNLI